MVKCMQRLRDLKLTRFDLFMIFGVYATGSVMRVGNVLFPVFANITPEWKCGEQGTFSKNCSVIQECVENITYRSPFFSARQEFGLICDRAYIAAGVSSLQFVGVLVGVNVLGQISDVCGRHKIALLVSCGELLLGLGSSFSSGPISLSALRFVTGFFSGGALVVMMVYIMESIKPHQRIFMFVFVSWPATVTMIIAIAYFTNNWRWYIAVTSISGAATPIILLIMTPESFKWAKDRGKEELAKRIATRIDWINGKAEVDGRELEPFEKLQEDPNLDVSMPTSSNTGRYAIKDLVANRKMITLTTIMCTLWPTVALTSYTIGFDSRNLEGNFYVNQLLMACFNLAANVLLFSLDTYVPKFNRRMLHQGPQLVVAIFTGTIAILLAAGIEGNARLAVTYLAVISTFFNSFIWDAVYLCTTELFPTEVRATAFGICNLFARIAVILAPQVVLLREVWEAGPYLLMSILGFIAFGISCKFLPETKNRELPSSVSDVNSRVH